MQEKVYQTHMYSEYRHVETLTDSGVSNGQSWLTDTNAVSHLNAM